jgi:pimeloyl-ACP methyl ester carboxylesterase
MFDHVSFGVGHILAFSPLPELAKVTCPVLGVFGELDPLSDAPVAAAAMRRALPASETKIFSSAGHSLSELPARSRMAPGVFETLRTWMRARVHLAGD